MNRREFRSRKRASALAAVPLSAATRSGSGGALIRESVALAESHLLLLGRHGKAIQVFWLLFPGPWLLPVRQRPAVRLDLKEGIEEAHSRSVGVPPTVLSLIAEVTERLSKVFDHLITEKLADPERIAALGTSRGEFVAFHFAAADKRVKCAAGFAPVTDLAVLSEFRGAQEHPLVQRLALERHAGALAGRALWLVIGDRDTRVGTDAAISFARRVTAVSLEKSVPALVDLHVIAETKPHSVPVGWAERAAEWFWKQMP